MITLSHEPGIGTYALYDINQDGIPELHTNSDDYDVFSIRDGELVHVCSAQASFNHGTVYVLQNGALLSYLNTTGCQYYYTTVDADLNVTVVTFFDGEGSAEHEENEFYDFNGKEVSKSEFQELTKNYFAQAAYTVTLQWYDYATGTPTLPDGKLSEDLALSLALEDAGCTKDQIENLEIALDTQEDGNWHYDIRFQANDFQFQYEVHAYSGSVLKSEQEPMYICGIP